MPTICLTLSGDAATRCSWGRRSLMTATFILPRTMPRGGGNVKGTADAAGAIGATGLARLAARDKLRRPAPAGGLGIIGKEARWRSVGGKPSHRLARLHAHSPPPRPP